MMHFDEWSEYVEVIAASPPPPDVIGRQPFVAVQAFRCLAAHLLLNINVDYTGADTDYKRYREELEQFLDMIISAGYGQQTVIDARSRRH